MCSACDVHEVEMRKTERIEEDDKKNTQHRSNNFFEGIFPWVSIHFCQCNLRIQRNIYATAKQQTSTKTLRSSSKSSEFAQKHSHCYLEHENSHAIQIPLMKNHFKWLFLCSHSFVRVQAHIKPTPEITAPIFHRLLRFSPHEWGTCLNFVV